MEEAEVDIVEAVQVVIVGAVIDLEVIQAEAVDLDVTAATSYMVYIDTPLLQYVRVKVGNATTATGDAIKCTVRGDVPKVKITSYFFFLKLLYE